MKNKFNISNYAWILLLGTLSFVSCDDFLDRYPETTMSDASYWKTTDQLRDACNYLYTRLPGYDDLHSANNYSEESYGTGSNGVSAGTRTTPSTDDFWADRYKDIRSANNILEKSVSTNGDVATIKRYQGEARFFRAFAYYLLLIRYGDIPLLMKTVDIGDANYYPPRTNREIVVDSIYADLDNAYSVLPASGTLLTSEYGRITKSAAMALKSRVALFEGTRQKFHSYGNYQKHLNVAIAACEIIINSGEHSLYKYASSPADSYYQLFNYGGNGSANKENIFVRLYGENSTNNITQNNFGPWIDLGYGSPTRALLDAYIYNDGLPIDKTSYDTSRDSTMAEFQNRDPRAEQTVANKDYIFITTYWSPSYNAFQFSTTGYKARKGLNPDDALANKSFIHYKIIRYAEILLNYVEAKYELENSISDDLLNQTINAIRLRAYGYNEAATPKLTNAFVTSNGLNMRDEIRRERRVELAQEGLRYWDLLRWKTAETELPKDVIGSKWYSEEHAPNSAPKTDDGYVIVQTGRKFDPNKDYLWPIPLNEFIENPNLGENNPGW